MTAWEMYWILRLDAIRGFMLFCFIASLVLLFLTPVAAMEEGELTKDIKKAIAIWFFIAVFFLTSFCLIPSTKDMKEIYGIEQTQNGGGK